MQGHRRGVQWLEGPRTAAAVGRPPQGPLLGGRHGPPGARAGVPLGGSVPRLAARRSWTEAARPRGPRVPSRPRPRRSPPAGTRDPDRVRVSLLALPVVRADARAGPLRALPLVHQAAALAARARESAERPATVLGLADPVDLRIVLDRGVLRVHEDHLVVLVAAILSDPVRVQDLHVRVALRDSLFRHPLDRFPHRDLVHPAPLRVAPAHRPRLPPAAAAHLGPHDDVPGLRAVPELAGPVDPQGMLDPHERGAGYKAFWPRSRSPAVCQSCRRKPYRVGRASSGEDTLHGGPRPVLDRARPWCRPPLPQRKGPRTPDSTRTGTRGLHGGGLHE